MSFSIPFLKSLSAGKACRPMNNMDVLYIEYNEVSRFSLTRFVGFCDECNSSHGPIRKQLKVLDFLLYFQFINFLIIFIAKIIISDFIKDYISVWIVTQRHYCDVRKDIDQSNHTIPKISSQSCDFIGHFIFWCYSYDA